MYVSRLKWIKFKNFLATRFSGWLLGFATGATTVIHLSVFNPTPFYVPIKSDDQIFNGVEGDSLRFYRYTNVGMLVDDCQHVVNSTLVPEERKGKSNESESVRYKVQQSTALMREGTMFNSTPFIRSVYSQIILSAYLKSESGKGMHDGKHIYVLASSIRNSPFHIDQIFFANDNDQTRSILYNHQDPFVDELNRYYRVKYPYCVQTILKDGKAQSIKSIPDDTFVTQESEETELLQTAKSYFEFERKDLYNSVLLNVAKIKAKLLGG